MCCNLETKKALKSSAPEVIEQKFRFRLFYHTFSECQRLTNFTFIHFQFSPYTVNNCSEILKLKNNSIKNTGIQSVEVQRKSCKIVMKYKHKAAQIVWQGPFISQHYVLHRVFIGFQPYELWGFFFFHWGLFQTAKSAAGLHLIKDVFDQAQTSRQQTCLH